MRKCCRESWQNQGKFHHRSSSQPVKRRGRATRKPKTPGRTRQPIKGLTIHKQKEWDFVYKADKAQMTWYWYWVNDLCLIFWWFQSTDYKYINAVFAVCSILFRTKSSSSQLWSLTSGCLLRSTPLPMTFIIRLSREWIFRLDRLKVCWRMRIGKATRRIGMTRISYFKSTTHRRRRFSICWNCIWGWDLKK